MANTSAAQRVMPEPDDQGDLTRPVLLLVHGAWHGAWIWEKVHGVLATAGWEVQTLDLPSTAASGATRYGMHHDAQVVQRHIQQIGRPVVVVAHSYGGTPVTEGAADIPNVRHLIYLAALQLDVGESQLMLSGGTPAPWWIIEGDTVTPDRPREIFYADVPLEEAERAIAQLRPQSLSVVKEIVSAAAWHTVPSTYVVCEQDRAIPPGVQEMMAKRATSVRHMHTSHSPFLSRPDQLAQLIAEVAATSA
jgi:pimeloyl-ACP methyl ester carboxylesterase